MFALTEMTDRFVRWFFNSSPTSMAIESHGDEPGRVPAFWRKGMLGGAAVIALILLMVFYSVVAGAVDRAAKRQMATQVEAALTSGRSWHRPVAVASGSESARAAAFAPRTVSYVRRTN